MSEKWITKEDHDSLKKAFLACSNWTKEDHDKEGVRSTLYQGEAQGWKFALAEEGEKYEGYAWHFEKALEVPLGPRVADTWFKNVSIQLRRRSS